MTAAFDEMGTEGVVRAPYRTIGDWLATTPPEVFAHKRREAEILFRRIGISNEVQTGDDTFDRAMYVVSDLPVARDALRRDPELRRRLLAAFQYVQQHRYVAAEAPLITTNCALTKH